MRRPARVRKELAWTRPQLERDHPIRTAGGFYRTAEGSQVGIGGVPLTTAEDAVVAAVRLAYRVADAQIERSTRLALRLRKAGDRQAGGSSERKTFDAAEQLAFRGMMSALAWVETAAANDADNPLRRLLSAEFRLLGSLLGLDTAGKSRHAEHRSPDYRPPAATTQPPPPAQFDTQADQLTIFLLDSKRPVQVRRFHLRHEARGLKASLRFYSVENIGHKPIIAELSINDIGNAELGLTIAGDAPGGLWKAAICKDDKQLGLIEIEL